MARKLVTTAVVTIRAAPMRLDILNTAAAGSSGDRAEFCAVFEVSVRCEQRRARCGPPVGTGPTASGFRCRRKMSTRFRADRNAVTSSLPRAHPPMTRHAAAHHPGRALERRPRRAHHGVSFPVARRRSQERSVERLRGCRCSNELVTPAEATRTAQDRTTATENRVNARQPEAGIHRARMRTRYACREDTPDMAASRSRAPAAPEGPSAHATRGVGERRGLRLDSAATSTPCATNCSPRRAG